MSDLRKILDRHQLDLVTLPQSTATAQQAADALECQLGQIAKSICFWADDRPLLVIASGVNRVNQAKVTDFLQVDEVRLMSPEEVEKQTGFKVGGVPPFGHQQEIETIIDEDLLNYETIWAAGGNPNSVFEISPHQLQKITTAKVSKIQ